MFRIIEISGKEAKEKYLEEEASIEILFTMEKKGIKHLNFSSANEKLIEELKVRLELCMLLKMPNHLILKMSNVVKS